MSTYSDVALVAVPQWSPFQPPLSLPSLASWLRRGGHTCTVHDENIRFYDYLVSERAAALLIGNVEPLVARSQAVLSAIDGIQSWRDFRNDISKLLRWRCEPFERLEFCRKEILHDTYRAVNSLDTYLRFVSELSPDFSISPYEFRIKHGELDRNNVETFIKNCPDILSTFINEAVERILSTNPRVVGLSCIGQEQLLFALLFGKTIKEKSRVPVVVGGTVFSRIFERGALPVEWMTNYIDIIVRNEGEKPLENIVSLFPYSKEKLSSIAGVVYADNGTIRSTVPEKPLKPNEIPAPAFEDLIDNPYVSAHLTLPLLSSRGCYWGKCEFCHHGMVYGEKYANYSSQSVVETIALLRQKYGVLFYSLNDEAIPPKIFRQLGHDLPKDAGIFFTGLMKFEEYFTASDFLNAYSIGFRSLYVGLESASERVLALMRKNTAKSVIESNLQDATAAGVWMHCFLFFGFPGETEEDAQETIEFILSHSNHIGSFGAGTFSLEHNAPIMKHLDQFNIKTIGSHSGDIDVYYRYEVSEGNSAADASHYLSLLNERAFKIEKFVSTNWIPREHLLILLSLFNADELTDHCTKLLTARDVQIFPLFSDEMSHQFHGSAVDVSVRIINRLNRTAIEVKGATAQLMRLIAEEDIPIDNLYRYAPWVAEGLRSTSAVRLSMHDSDKVI